MDLRDILEGESAMPADGLTTDRQLHYFVF